MSNDDRDMYVELCIEEYIKTHTIRIIDLIDSNAKTAQQIRIDLISKINEQLTLANQLRSKDCKIRMINSLPGYAVAKLLIATGDVKKLTLGASGYKIIARRYYKNADEWKWAGTHEIINRGDYDNSVMRAFSLMIPDASAHDENSLIRYIACHAPSVTMHTDNTLVYFRNGVWDYKTKTLTAYDAPDFDQKYGKTIALAKLPVYHPYGANAVLQADENGCILEPVIHNDNDGTDWRPSDCYTAPFDMTTDVGRASNLIMWQLTQFLIRHINGSPHLYHFWVDAGGKGHNGKSTLWEIMQRLVKMRLGPDDDDLRASGDTVIDCPIEDLEKDYLLSQNITTAYAIVGQESKGATNYIENCSLIKMLARAQEYTYRQIRQEPFSYRFEGALIQQINKAPMFSEKTDAMFSHSVNIPFVNSFDDSRAYIKKDYILREDVAEWLAYHVTVEMDCLDAYDHEALKTLEPFKREMMCDGMSTMQALDEIVPGLKMNFIPTELLYDLYVRWCDKNGVTGRAVVSMKTFKDDLEQYGINNTQSVDYTKKYARTSVKDLEQEHPAMIDFGLSDRNRMTVYARQANHEDMINYKGHLDPKRFTESGKAKLWTKGGLKRNVKWQDIKTSEIVAEIDEDAEA